MARPQKPRYTQNQLSEACKAAVKIERERCAKIVETGGDGFDIMETAIQVGPNNALAAVIRSGLNPPHFPLVPASTEADNRKRECAEMGAPGNLPDDPGER